MPDENREELLLARARRGEEAALLSLYERHHAQMFRFACRLLDSAQTAEDVVHDCFLDLVRAPPATSADFDAARGTLRNYLLGMVRHRALKTFRRTARECELDEDASERRCAPARDEPLERLLENELSEVVRRAVAELPPLQMETLVLFEYEELSLAEVAEVVGADVSTVKARLFRARRGLKKTLAPYLSPCGAEALALKN
ncbi:MAG: polymerase sigma-70 factor, subfamily [Acidobacteriota bacterium]|nr:polymerase sigma-70 factor, subfamily [Acidobacteriota bacterium]